MKICCIPTAPNCFRTYSRFLVHTHKLLPDTRTTMVHHKIVSAAVQPGLLPEQAKPNDEDKKVTRDTCQDASEDGKTADSSSDHKQLGDFFVFVIGFRLFW